MVQPQIRYDDGAAYERMMGAWSRIAGEIFLDWLAPPPGLRWIDVGCGTGAFTELLVERCAPAEVQGIDPSEAQLSFARARPAGRTAEFHRGDALALPFGGDNFDAAVMALVIFFVPDPTKGVAEMARVVRPGGTVATYVWDMMGGGDASPESTKNRASRIDCTCLVTASRHMLLSTGFITPRHARARSSSPSKEASYLFRSLRLCFLFQQGNSRRFAKQIAAFR